MFKKNSQQTIQKITEGEIAVIGNQIYVTIVTPPSPPTPNSPFRAQQPPPEPPKDGKKIREEQIIQLESLPWNKVVDGYDFLVLVQEFASLLRTWDYDGLEKGQYWCFLLSPYEFYIQLDTKELSLHTTNANIRFYVDFTKTKGFRRTGNGNEIQISVGKYITLRQLKSTAIPINDADDNTVGELEVEIDVQQIGNRKVITKTKAMAVGGAAGAGGLLVIVLLLIWILSSSGSS